MLLFGPLCLLLCWIQAANFVKIPDGVFPRQPIQAIPLNRVENAVDDMYFGCNHIMEKMVQKKYFEKENNGEFANVWKQAESCTNRNLKEREKGDESLTKAHMHAICAYTAQRFHKIFNDHVRENKTLYTSSFKFHYLHFWLTSAVQILSDNRKCETTYRRTTVLFRGKPNQIIRFGQFASSSFHPNLIKFGSETCFKIQTCSGAYLKNYSRLRKTEEEVLIPPYELFKIMKSRPVAELSDCKVVHVLQSVGVESTLNCRAAFPPGSSSPGRAN